MMANIKYIIKANSYIVFLIYVLDFDLYDFMYSVRINFQTFLFEPLIGH